jgi:hypothetical protein
MGEAASPPMSAAHAGGSETLASDTLFASDTKRPVAASKEKSAFPAVTTEKGTRVGEEKAKVWARAAWKKDEGMYGLADPGGPRTHTGASRQTFGHGYALVQAGTQST